MEITREEFMDFIINNRPKGISSYNYHLYLDNYNDFWPLINYRGITERTVKKIELITLIEHLLNFTHFKLEERVRVIKLLVNKLIGE